MKTRAITLTTIFLIFTILLNAQYTSIPDNIFEWELMGLGYDDVEDGYVLTSNISSITSLDVSDSFIGDLTGIEDFISLEVLLCQSNYITSLDLSQNLLLTELSCHNNLLTSLDISQNTALIEVNCHHNQLASIDITQSPGLTTIYCDYNQLTSLDVSQNTALIVLSCGYNQLVSLNVTQNTAMGALFCYDNQLTTLDISKNTEMTVLDCRDNELVSLNLTQNSALEHLYCSLNQLTTLDVSNNTALSKLNCSVNSITSLNLTHNIALTELECINNQLTSLDITQNTVLGRLKCTNNQLVSLDLTQNSALEHLYCDYNQLSSLDIGQNTALTDLRCGNNQLTSLDITQNTALLFLSCGNNQLTGLDLTPNTYLQGLSCYYNQLLSLDVANGNNASLLYFDATNNTSLTCIQIDNKSDADAGLPPYNNWQKDAIATYSENCTNSLETYVPDDNFEQVLIDLGYDDILDDKVITSNISGINSLDVSNNNIEDLTGIEDFSSLSSLYCQVNELSSLDLSQNNFLTIIHCGWNQLVNVNVQNGNNIILTDFDAINNPSLLCIQVDNESNANAGLPPYATWQKDDIASYSEDCSILLYYTAIPDNIFEWELMGLGYDDVEDGYVLTSNISNVTSLDVSNSLICDLTGIEDFISLEVLLCQSNSITSLDLSQNLLLTELSCHNNLLTSLDISTNTALIEVNCHHNQLASLDINQSTALTTLYCDYNQLTSLDVSQNTALIVLSCGYNQLASLNVTQNTAMGALFCYDNQLTNLDISQNTEMAALDCRDNELGSLDARNGNNASLLSFDAKLNPSLTCIQVDNETDANAGLPPYHNWQKDPGASYSEDCMNLEKTLVPDDNFEQALIDLGYDDVIDDYVLTENISGITSLDISGKNIIDLTGIEDFIGLTHFYCYDNQITSIDVTQNSALNWLHCMNNQLTSLDVSQNSNLMYLACNSNQLSSLDVSLNPALTSLYCQMNQLISLNVSQNSALIYLDCRANQLTNLDLSQNSALTHLNCFDNQLTNIDVSQNSVLTQLYCWNNQLTDLNVGNGNNSLITNFNSTNNPSLTCIQVDNETDANAGMPPYNSWEKDEAASYSEDCNSTEVFIPDPNFEQALIDLGIDSEGVIDQKILISDAEGVTSLNVFNPTSNPNLPNVTAEIADLTGIEAFINLISLSCGNNQLTFLDVSNAADLLFLYCGGNQLSGLDISQNINLKRLDCYYNQLTSLDVSQNTALTILRCYNNHLTSLDVTGNTALTELACLSNQLPELDVTLNTLLTKLNCEANHTISSLDVSQNAALVELNCGANAISDLDVSQNISLEKLVCYSNSLTGLDITQNTQLEFLFCMWNEIASLDLSQNTLLTSLGCTSNQLTILDLSQNIQLTALDCSSNQITDLDMRNGNNVNVTNFDASNNFLSCINVDNEKADHSAWTVDPDAFFSNDCKLNTQVGEDVIVELVANTSEKTAKVTYDEVILSGATTLETDATGPEFPDGFEAGDPLFVYYIETTAEYSETIKIAIDYADMAYEDEASLRLFHYENELWTDVTTWVDFANKIIHGEVTSLSPFAILEDVQPTVIESIDAPLDPVALGDAVTVSVTFTDNNLAEAWINWGDTTDNVAGIIVGQSITWEYTYNFPGVYTLSVLLVDACDRITEAIYQYVVIYNPDGGFVTGGGWIYSPPGAYVADPLLEGKANFGFVSKYKKGANVPTGTTEFQFKAGDLNFNSYVYDWLVIAGAKAKFKGEGTINGEGAYGFMISAIDGALTNNGSDDKMRIKIWDEDEIVVYDNELGTGINGDPTTILGGGSIVIHNPKDKNSELSEADLLEFASEENQEPVLNIFPNPVAHFLNIEVTGSPEENIQLKIFNALGELKYSSRGLGMLNEKINVTDYSSGFYLIAAQVNDKLIIRKLLKNN